MTVKDPSKAERIEDFKVHENDDGSTPVQVAVLVPIHRQRPRPEPHTKIDSQAWIVVGQTLKPLCRWFRGHHARIQGKQREDQQ